MSRNYQLCATIGYPHLNPAGKREAEQWIQDTLVLTLMDFCQIEFHKSSFGEVADLPEVNSTILLLDRGKNEINAKVLVGTGQRTPVNPALNTCSGTHA